MDGGTVDKKINQELTYKELTSSINNLWSVLFMTGYLTSHEKGNGNTLRLSIPNLCVREIFVDQIYEWFQEEMGQRRQNILKMCDAFQNGDAKTAEEIFQDFLEDTISIRDNNAPIEKKENFYHGILLVLLSFMNQWNVQSNVESGYGYSDILIQSPKRKIGIVIEIKFGENRDMGKGCREALQQIEEKNYVRTLERTNMETINLF